MVVVATPGEQASALHGNSRAMLSPESEPLASKEDLLSWIKQEEPPGKGKWELERETNPVLGYGESAPLFRQPLVVLGASVHVLKSSAAAISIAIGFLLLPGRGRLPYCLRHWPILLGTLFVGHAGISGTLPRGCRDCCPSPFVGPFVGPPAIYTFLCQAREDLCCFFAASSVSRPKMWCQELRDMKGRTCTCACPFSALTSLLGYLFC